MNFFKSRSWGRVLAGVLLSSAGLVCLIVTTLFLARDASIWVFGRSVEAEVLELRLERADDYEEGELSFEYFVRYQFATSNGRVVVSSSPISGIEWSGLTEGSLIDIRYFPLYPEHNRLDDSRYVPLLVCTYIPLVFLSWVVLSSGWYLVRTGLSRSKGQSWHSFLGRA